MAELTAEQFLTACDTQQDYELVKVEVPAAFGGAIYVPTLGSDQLDELEASHWVDGKYQSSQYRARTLAFICRDQAGYRLFGDDAATITKLGKLSARIANRILKKHRELNLVIDEAKGDEDAKNS